MGHRLQVEFHILASDRVLRPVPGLGGLRTCSTRLTPWASIFRPSGLPGLCPAGQARRPSQEAYPTWRTRGQACDAGSRFAMAGFTGQWSDSAQSSSGPVRPG